MNGTARRATAHALAAADLEVELVVGGLPVGRARRTSAPLPWDRHRRGRRARARQEAPLDGEGGVLGRAFGHEVLLGFFLLDVGIGGTGSSLSASKAPSRSKLTLPALRAVRRSSVRPPSAHGGLDAAGPDASGSSASAPGHSPRAPPDAGPRPRAVASSGRASSLTDAGPRLNRSTMIRRRRIGQGLKGRDPAGRRSTLDCSAFT